jgi:hypothetical protein
MQTDRYDRGWAAGPRPRIGLTALAAIAAGGALGALLGWAIERLVLPGASFAVLALSLVGVALGGLYTTWLLGEPDDPEDG